MAKNSTPAVVNNSKKKNDPKKKDSGAKKQNILIRMGKAIARKVKEIVSELRKVTWPTLKFTTKQTMIVIAVVLFFLVILTIFDFGLYQLFRLLIGRGET
jgi:preprotein translocase SecE subunit